MEKQPLPVDNKLTPPIKTYTVVKNSTFSHRRLELRRDNVPFLWVKEEPTFFSRPTITMRLQSSKGPIVATCKLQTFSDAVDVVIGDNPDPPKEHYASVQADSIWHHGSYSFPGVDTGQIYQWRRTHNQALGASVLGSSNFKLVDPSNGNKVLAVYIKDSMWGLDPAFAHFDFMVELGDDLELQAITAMMGLQEKIRRRS